MIKSIQHTLIGHLILCIYFHFQIISKIILLHWVQNQKFIFNCISLLDFLSGLAWVGVSFPSLGLISVFLIVTQWIRNTYYRGHAVQIHGWVHWVVGGLTCRELLEYPQDPELTLAHGLSQA